MQDESCFERLTDEQIEFAIEDISKALEACGSDPVAYGKYSDQMSAAFSVQRKRQGKDRCQSCGHVI